MVLEHGSPLALDGRCVSHTDMSVAYVFLMLVAYVLVVHAWWWSWFQLCRHEKVDSVDVVFFYHEYMLVMHWLCMSVFVSIVYVCDSGLSATGFTHDILILRCIRISFYQNINVHICIYS